MRREVRNTMVWRVGGLLVTTGLVLELTLSGGFVLIGFAAMFAGLVVLALGLEDYAAINPRQPTGQAKTLASPRRPAA
jgi:hypothetical protein